MFRVSVLLAALLVNAPTIWATLGTQSVPVQTMMIRFLISVPIMAVLLAGVRVAMNPSSRPAKARAERRRS